MKTLLIFAFTIALAVSAVPPSLNKYLPNKEYVYKWESEALTGIPAASNHLAGIKVVAKVHLLHKGANKFILAVRNIQLCEVNEKIKMLHHLVPAESGAACTQVPEPSIVTALEESLAKPIRFRWENGQISLLQTEDDDASWSANLKKGLVNMLNVNLQELEAIPAVPRHLKEAIEAAVPSGGQRTLSNYFRVMESDLLGKCESIYAIQEEPGQEKRMVVTKVRNFDACVTRPLFQTGILAQLDCHACSPKLPMRTQAYATYAIAGNRQEFVIKSAVQNGLFIFKPLAAIDGQATAFTKQRLELLDVPETPSAINLGKKRVQRDPFHFEIPSQLTRMAPEAAPVRNAAELAALLEKRIDDVVNSVESPEVAKRVPELVPELVGIMRLLPTAKLTEIVTRFLPEARDEAGMRKRELVLDLLPMTGRPDIAPILEALIGSADVSKERVALMINAIALTAEPAPFLIKELLALYPKVKQHTQVARSVVLAAGALTHTMNKLFVSTNVPKEFAAPARTAIFQEVKTLLNGALSGPVEEQLLVLKAVGNAGLAEAIPLLEGVIRDGSKKPHVRAKAIYALRRVTPLAKHKVHEVCLPIVLAPEEPLEVRLAALLITVHSRPESGAFTMIAQQLPKDPSIQFTNFAQSLLKAVAQSELPCNRNISEAARAAIREAYTIFSGWPLSKTINYELILSHIHNLGADIAMDLVTPGVSALPEIIVTRVNAYFAKALFNVLEVGVETKGVLTLLRNLFGPENQWMQVLEGKKSLADVVAPMMNPDVLNMGSIRSLLDGLSERELSGLAAHVYLKLFGSELRFFTLDNASIKGLIGAIEAGQASLIGKLAAGHPINIMKTIAVENQVVVLPTPVGLPARLGIASTTLVAAKGNLKLDGLRSLSDLISGTPRANMKFAVEPTIVSQTQGSLGVGLGFLRAEVALMARAVIKAPMAGELTADLATGKIRISNEIPNQEIRVLKAEVVPVAKIVRKLPAPTTKLFEITATPLYNPNVVLPIEVELPIGREALGVELLVKGRYAKPIAPLTPLRILCMPHEAELVIRPGADMPKAVEILAAYVKPGTPEAEAVKGSILEGGSGRAARNYWFSSGSSASGIAFEPVTPHSSISSPNEHQLLACIKTKGQSSARMVAAQATFITEATMQKIQADIQVGVKTTGEAKIAKIASVINVPPALFTSAAAPSAPEELAEIKFAYGPQGHTTEYVTMKCLYKILETSDFEYLKAAVAEEMKGYYFEKVDTSYRPPSPYTRATGINPRFAGKVQGGYEGRYATPEFKSVRPLQIILDAEYKPIFAIPAAMRPLFNRLFIRAIELPESWFYPRGYVTFEPKEFAPNKIQAVFTTLPTTATAEVILRMPTETVLIQGVTLPFPHFFYPYNRLPMIPELMKKISGHPAFAATCALKNGMMKTFDQVEYTLPETTCETVLAQDCSSQKLFRITAQKAAHAPSMKIVKLYVGRDRVEIEPAGSSGSQGVQIRVNGNPKTIGGDAPVPILGSSNQPICTVHKSGAMFHVEVKKLGVNIKTDCRELHMRLPAWFSGVVCGMCGNYDTEKVGDVTGPGKQRYPHPENAIADYIIPSGNCDAAEIQRKFRHMSPMSSACTPRPETVYIERTEGSQKLACFSAEPVMICPSACRAQSQKSRNMAFHCMPISDPQTQDLLNKMRQGPLSAVPRGVKTLHENVLTTPECQP